MRIIISPRAEKELRKIDKNDLHQIVKAVEELASEPLPRGCKKLVGHVSLYRIRSGNYRIIYNYLNNDILIEIIRVGHRKDVYKF